MFILQKSLYFLKQSLDLDIVPATITGSKATHGLHYDIDKDCVFCFYCIKNLSKLTAGKIKEPAYTLIGFKNWKKAPECFKDHQNSKFHKGAATLEIIVPSCGEPLAMMNQQLEKSRAEERKYLKVVMECIQYLARQGMPLRGSDHINDNLTQLLLLRSKDHPMLAERNFFRIFFK